VRKGEEITTSEPKVDGERGRLLQKVCEEALRIAKPSEEEKRRTLQFSLDLTRELSEKLSMAGVEAEVEVQGSVAKDTWLTGEKDIDIFILLPKSYGKEAFLKVLEVAKEVAKKDWRKAYAEHPYIEAKIKGYTVDFVPCFKVRDASEAASSVDRTPLHTIYMKQRLNEEARDQVRLLKKFMRGIGTYGAEIKVGGFSGYLCEVLTLHYGSFLKVLEAASKWKRGELIDIEGHYDGEREDAERLFQTAPLIVVDPIDKVRNLASSIRETKLNEFIAASREFQKRPSLRFFYPKDVRPLPTGTFIRALRRKGTSLIIVKFGPVEAVPDILWGQLYRSHRAVRNLIRHYDFRILRDCVWSDERDLNILLFELESLRLPATRRHLGPPVEKAEDCERFLKKHLNSEQVISGPRVEGDRWVVEVRRPYTDAAALLKEKLKRGGRELGIASLVSRAISESLEVLVDHEITTLYNSNREFAKFLTEYLLGRPRWLERSWDPGVEAH